MFPSDRIISKLQLMPEYAAEFERSWLMLADLYILVSYRAYTALLSIVAHTLLRRTTNTIWRKIYARKPLQTINRQQKHGNTLA